MKTAKMWQRVKWYEDGIEYIGVIVNDPVRAGFAKVNTPDHQTHEVEVADLSLFRYKTGDRVQFQYEERHGEWICGVITKCPHRQFCYDEIAKIRTDGGVMMDVAANRLHPLKLRKR